MKDIPKPISGYLGWSTIEKYARMEEFDSDEQMDMQSMAVELLESYESYYDNKSGECDLPPDGWICTRGNGHDGPCAAHGPNFHRKTSVKLKNGL